ncbi:MAG TPA: tetratricopeptide repeat protein, partial [Myxococcales bacterium]|nr:tetratricopeptide repeat protein [Myxococcales bacterium]
DQDKVARLSLKRAQVLEAQLGDKSEALKNYSAILEQRPSDPDALAALEHLLSDPSCCEEAAKALIPAYEAVKEHRKLIHALEVVATSSQDDLEKVLALKKAAYVHLHLLRQPELAFASLARAMRLAPGDAQIRTAARQAAEDADQLDAYAEVAVDALQALKDTARVPLHRELAEVYEKKLSKRDLAVEQLRAALELDGKNLDVLKALQRLHRAADEWESLADVLLKLAAVVPEPSEKVHLWREAAFLYEDKLTNQEAAAAAWRQIAERDPLDRESAAALDQLYTALDKPQELAFALELRRAQEGQSPQGRELAYRLAQVRQHKLSDSAGALQLYRHIVTEDPGHKGARAALEEWVVNKGPVSAAALEILDPVLVQLSDHHKRVQLREARMDDALMQEKARLAAEICAIYERDLGQAELAFMAALRAFSAGIDQEGLQPELERLAKATGSFDELAEVYENAAAGFPPGDVQGLAFQSRAAELREQLGQPDEAVRLWKLVLENAPQDRQALDSLGRLFEQSQNAKSLSEVYARKANLSADPAERLDLLLKAGAAFEAAGDDERAIEHFRTALALRKTLEGLASLDRLYGKAKRTEEQADVLDQLAALAQEPDEQRGYLSRRALLLEKEGGPGEAVAAFTRVLELAPNDPTALAGLERMLGNEAVRLEAARVLEPVYRSLNDGRKLVEILDLRLATAVSGRRLELLDEIARLREGLGEKAQAFAARMQAFSESPGSPELFAELDRLAAETGSFEDLAALYEEHLQRGLPDALQLELWRRVAGIHGERLNRPDLAARAWTEVARKDPSDMRALESLAAIYRKTRAFKELAQIMKRQVGLEKNVASQIQLLFELARLAEETLSDKALAAQCYQAIMARKPDDQNAIKFLSRVLADTERWPELAALLQKEIQLCDARGLQEESCDLQIRLGRLKLSRLGDPRGALELYQGVLQKRPSHAGAVGALEEMAKSDSPLRGEAASILEPIFAGGGDYLKTVQMLESRYSAATSPAQRADLQRRIASLYADQMGNPSMAFLAATKAFQETPDDETSLRLCLDLASAAEATDELSALLEEVGERATEEKARLNIRRALAQLHTQSGDEDRAIDSWKSVLELDPSNPEALDRLSELLAKVGNGPELAEVLRRKLQLTEDPDERAQLMFEIGDLQYGALKDAHGALATFRLVLEQKADSIPVLERMEQLSSELERWPELADVISRRIALTAARLEQQGHPDPQSHKEIQDLKFRLAQVREVRLLDKVGALQMYTEILGAEPRHPGALQRMEAIVQREPGNVGALDVLLQAYRQGGDGQKLGNALEARVALCADPFERRGLYRELAEVRLGQQEPEMAFLAFFRAFKDDPNDAELRAELEKAADSAGTHDELAHVYEEELPRIAEAKDAAAVCLKLGTLYEHRLKEAERAVGVYERARTFDPELGQKALPALDRLYSQLEAWQELAQILEAEIAASDQPGDKVKLLFRLGQLQQDRLQSEEAAAGAYERLLQVDKTHLASARLLEQIYESQGQVDKLYVVLKLQRDAVQGPERDRILSRMAQVSAEGLADVGHSIEIYQELLAKNPRNEQAFTSLEGLLEKAGRHEELYELLRKKLGSVLDPRELVRLNEKVGRVLFRMAGKAEEAIPFFKAALDRDARHKSALDSLREIYDQLQRKDELVVVLRRLLPLQEQAEGVKAVRLRLAEVLAEMGRREEALDAARRALEVEPHQVAEMERVHQIFLGLRAWADAARALEMKAELHAQVEERDQAVATLFQVADLWRGAANKPENAGPPLEKILEVDPANRSAYEQAIDLHAKHNDWRAYAQAVDRYLPHLVTDEEKVEALKDLARVQEQRLGQNDLAFMAACRALQLNPADDGIREEVERLADETGSHDEIAAVYEEVADELPRGPLAERIYLKLAQIQDEKLDDASEAEASLRKILEFDPTNHLALDRLAQMFARRGADTEYVMALEQKLEAAGSIEDRKVILREIARVYDERQQNPDEAAAALLRALELEPDEETLRVITDLYRRQQKWPDVANTLLRARDLAATPEQRGQLQCQVAEVYEREMGDDEAAIAAYAQALEFDPAQRDALNALERLYTKLDRPGDLLQTYASQLELTSDVRERVKIFFKSASIWEDKYQNLEHADTCIQNVLEIDPANIQAITMLERMRRAQERWEDLVAVFDRHLQVVESSEEQAQILVEAGEIFYHQLRQVDRAAQSYTRALEVEPHNRAAMHALGLLYERSGNWPFALEMLTREAEAYGPAGEAVELYHRMGKINEEMLLDIDSARHSYERALQVDPGFLPSIRALKGIYESTKDWSAYEQALIQEAERTEDPEAKSKAYLEVARHTEETKEDKEGAARWYEEALRLEPELLEAARPLADIYIAREDWEKGERMLDIVVKEMPVRVTGKPDEHSLSKELCRQYYRLGYVVEKLAKKDKALACYEKAYQLDATYLPALEGLGNMLVQARRLEEALKVYQSILIHHRDDLTDLEVVEVYWQIGDIHYGLKQYDRAQNHFEKAMAIDPHHEPTLRALVQLADGAGKWDKSAEYRQQLVQVLDGEQKFSMYVELGMLAREKLKDPYTAIDAYGWAHKMQPEALDVMDALYQLYRETKQGAKAAEIVEKLLQSPELKTKPEQAKRIHYALGEIARDELKDLDRAVAAFNAALDADHRFLEAFSAIEALLGANKQWKKLEENYARMIQRLPKTEETHAARMTLWRALGDLYLRVLKQPQDALMAYKVVAAGLPLDAPVQETYAELASQFPGNEDEAIGAYRRALLQSQNQGKVCSALAELAARKRDYDTAYLAAQVAQSLIGQAGDAEKEILTKLQPYAKRKEVAQRPVSEAQWQGQLFHPAVRGPLGQLLALIFNQAGHLWAVQLAQYQINPKRHRIDVGTAPEYQIHHFRYVAKLLGMEHVELYSPFLVATRERMAKRSNDPAPDPTVAVEICHSHPMTLRVGGRFFGEAGQKEVYYLLGRTMALMRPELALATRLSPERLDAVLQAAITLAVPNFRITAHPQAVGEERRALEKALTEPIRAQLARMVQQYLKAAAQVDVKGYLEGVELTGVRTGLFVAGEVEPAKKMVLNETGGSSRLTSKSKLRDLAVFAL